MKYMQDTKTDYKTNAEMVEELIITPVLDKIQDYRRNWLHHTNRQYHNRLLRIINYRPKGRRK
jgi:DNA polymerase I-like protein with 3'-5' exonuclease and polymerase domains